MLYRLQDVVVEFGGHRVFGPLSFQHNPGEKLVLVGRNGSGKSTLLKVIAGDLEPNSGSIVKAKELAIARVEQILSAPPGTPVLTFVLEAFPGLLELEAQRQSLAERLSDPQALGAYQKVEDELAKMEADRARPRAQAYLQGLGIPQELHHLPLGQLSGGQKTRVALARALLSPAELLLLDEPSNHLDLVGTEFLAEALRERKKAVLVVTHDRALMDAVGGDILELAGGMLERYRGPFARYQKERQARREQQKKAFELQQAEIARQEEFIRRNIAGQNTRQAQARIKLLEKLERVAPPPPDPQPIKLRWPAVARSGDRVVEARGLVVGYQNPVLKQVDLTLGRGERLALVGRNGSGKSTLLKTLAGVLPPLAGSLRWGTGVVCGYYDQEQDLLASGGSVLGYLESLRPDWSPLEVRNWAGAFGLSGEAAERPLEVLSGGERSRVQLAGLLAQAPNLLLLDEPTNHLDLPTCAVLEEALKDFPGAVVFVSHDRALVEAVATGVVLVAEGSVQPVNSVSEAFASLGLEKPRTKTPAAPGRRRSPQEEERRQLQRELTRMEQALAEVEGELLAIEKSIGELEAELTHPEVIADPQRLAFLASNLQALKTKQESLWQRWCQAAEAVESFRTVLRAATLQ
uniref:ATP-binding cassette domain-containing protein n=1 Tax=Thermoanaerobaculum aquaticum TaxID=1312852 RepID=A0A7V2EEE9_9BACT